MVLCRERRIRTHSKAKLSLSLGGFFPLYATAALLSGAAKGQPRPVPAFLQLRVQMSLPRPSVRTARKPQCEKIKQNSACKCQQKVVHFFHFAFFFMID